VNPFLGAWLVLDLLAVVALLHVIRAGASHKQQAGVVLGLQVAAVAAAGASMVASEPNAASWFTWITIVLVNLAFAVAGFTVGMRLMSMFGVVVTVAAVVLILLHSFASIAVAAVAAVFCVAGALLPRRARERPVVLSNI